MPTLGATLALGGCPAPGLTTNPFDTPRDGPPVISVCYAPGVTDRKSEIMPIAREGCAEATVGDVEPRFWKRTFFLNDCPLFKPMRISFSCEAATTGAGVEPALPAPAAAPAGDDVPPLTGPQRY